MLTVRRALISVSDKRGLIPFAMGLHELGIEILSTGGTCQELVEAGIPADPSRRAAAAASLVTFMV